MEETCVILLDNGSLSPEPTLQLRRIAGELGARLGQRAHPVSLKHSSNVPASSLGGESAWCLEEFLKKALLWGARQFKVVPLFFGPSSGVVTYAPELFKKVAAASRINWQFAKPLVDLESPEDDRLAGIIASMARSRLKAAGMERIEHAILVDHGSPSQSVADCRNLVAVQLQRLLAREVGKVLPASMERRPGAQYAFNEPLLECAMESKELLEANQVLLSYMFLFPGRHAGLGGDVRTICENSRFCANGGQVYHSDLVGCHPGLVDLLESRFEAMT